MDLTPKSLIILLAIAVVSFSSGFLLGQYGPDFKNIKDKDKKETVKQNLITTSPLFQTQTASIQGEIIAVGQSSVTIKDKKDATDTFPVSTNVVVYKNTQSSGRILPATGITQIDTNQEAVILLEVVDGKYQVISVTYPSKATAIQPSTQSATNKKP